MLSLQRFIEHRRSVARNLVRGLLDTPTWATSKRWQGSANSAPRVVSDIHRRGPDWFTEAKRSNPVNRVSVALSVTLSEPLSPAHRRRTRGISKPSLTRENTKNGNEMTSG